MSGLLDEVLTAHGELDRWRAVTALTAHVRFSGLLRSRFPGNRMATVTVRIESAQQRAVFYGFPQQDQQAVFDRGDVRIETRDDELITARRKPRAAFAGLSGVRRNLHWDALDAAYFAGYACWNYLSTPFLLTRDGVTVTECDTWPEAGEQWRRLDVSFPPDLHTHSRRQTSTSTLRGSSAGMTTLVTQSAGGPAPPTTALTTDPSGPRLSRPTTGAPTRTRGPKHPASDSRRLDIDQIDIET